MKVLKNLLEDVTQEYTIEQCNSKFKEIAKLLLENYAIKSSSAIYRITDIEFYYYDSKIHDKRKNDNKRNVTYERTTPAGCWFFHDSGIDISFESNKEKGYGGGILIRGIKKVKPIQEETIKGQPNVCYWKLFDEYTDAFEETAPNPHIITYKYTYKPEIKISVRHGLKEIDNNQLWRFYIDI